MRRKRHADPNVGLADENCRRSGAGIECGYGQEGTKERVLEVRNLPESAVRESP